MIRGVQALSLYKLFQFVIKFRTGGSFSLIFGAGGGGGSGIGAIRMDSNLEDEWRGIVREIRFLSLYRGHLIGARYTHSANAILS